MLKTHEGKPYCLLMEQVGSKSCEVPPQLLDAIMHVMAAKNGEIRIVIAAGVFQETTYTVSARTLAPAAQKPVVAVVTKNGNGH